MSDQLDLWAAPQHHDYAVTRPMARRTDPDTARDAAILVLPTAASVREQCLAALREHGPMTDFQLAAIVGRQPTSAGVRRKELERAGLVEVVLGGDGKPLRRPSPSGTPAMVWRAVS